MHLGPVLTWTLTRLVQHATKKEVPLKNFVFSFTGFASAFFFLATTFIKQKNVLEFVGQWSRIPQKLIL